ncbi:MAG: Hpt domain-containing protein [Magnetococcales bacterium]|nr:Hpt domain-containing protein [Magnetococcales bacterium]
MTTDSARTGFAGALRALGGDRGLFREVAEIYLADAPLLLTRIDQAARDGDTGELVEAAHKFKGASGAFGASPLFDLALELERLGRRKEQGPRLVTIAAALATAFVTFRQALEEEMQRGDSHDG